MLQHPKIQILFSLEKPTWEGGRHMFGCTTFQNCQKIVSKLSRIDIEKE